MLYYKHHKHQFWRKKRVTKISKPCSLFGLVLIITHKVVFYFKQLLNKFKFVAHADATLLVLQSFFFTNPLLQIFWKMQDFMVNHLHLFQYAQTSKSEKLMIGSIETSTMVINSSLMLFQYI